MSYADDAYYRTDFGGGVIPAAEVPRFLRLASDVVDMVVYQPVSEVTDGIKKAVCYEAEMLYLQGGEDAAVGLSTSAFGITERLGDYQLTRGTAAMAQMTNTEKNPLFYHGIPVSPFTVELLRREGLMCRVYHYDEKEKTI